jgi:hypothetical protein
MNDRYLLYPGVEGACLVDLATQEVEVGESLESRSSRPAWAALTPSQKKKN